MAIKAFVNLSLEESEPPILDRAGKIAAGEKLKEADLPEFPTERQPYWKDHEVNVVTETYAVVNKHGGWVVKKKKYLEYPDGRTEEL